MHTKRSIRPFVIGTPVSRTLFAIIRVLIGSYFLAAGTGLVLEPSRGTLFDGVLPEQWALTVTTVYLFCTAFAIMTGKFVRCAALLLALYIFWSAFIAFEALSTPESLSEFWRDMTLLGAVLLVAVTEPGGTDSFRLWRRGRAVSPRRIAPHRNEVGGLTTTLGNPGESPRRVEPAAPLPRPEAKAEPRPEAEANIFNELWDDVPLPSLGAGRLRNG